MASLRRGAYGFVAAAIIVVATAMPMAQAQSFDQTVYAVRTGRLTLANLQSLAIQGRDGDARSAQLLAWLLATGKEVPVDLKLAFIWYLQSYVDGMKSSLEDARLVYGHMSMAEAASLDPAIITLARTGRIEGSASPAEPIDAANGYNPAAVRAMLRDEAGKAHLIPALAEAVGYVESRFHPAAISDKGARGVMQIMPATGASLQTDPRDLFDPRTNIRTGVKYLTQLLQQYGRVDKALAHYVGGTAAAASYPAASSEVRQYVANVLAVTPEFAKLNGAPVPKGGFPGLAGTQVAILSPVTTRSAATGRRHMTRQGSVTILRGVTAND